MTATQQRLTRRAVLGGGAAAAVSMMTAGPAASATPDQVFQFLPGFTPTREMQRRVVVIGSGFGGAVSALRLGQAGVDTLVLERGQWWPTGPDKKTFTGLLTPDKRCGWFRITPPILESAPTNLVPYAGVMERATFSTIDLIAGAGVGGGSLVYHGATWRPSATNFSRVMPALDWDEFEQVYYPRAEAMLGATPLPDDLLAHERYRMSRRLYDIGVATGMTPYRLPATIDWDIVRKELTGELPPWVTVGEGSYGVNYGSKKSLDTNYLKSALATGHAEIAPLHVVRAVSRNGQGKWVTDVHRINPYGWVLEKIRITSDALIMAAGSLNTSRLLVAAKARGTLLDLPDNVGEGWGNNGDRLMAILGSREAFGAPQGGTVINSSLAWDDPMPVTIEPSPTPLPIDIHLLTMFGMGIPDGRGKFVHNALTGQVNLAWPANADLASRTAIRAKLELFQQQIGGAIVDLNAVDKFCAHVLGGAVMNQTCDLAGRVHGNPGLYVIDSALIPGSTGAVNPSLTITAVAERCLDQITAHDVGTVF